MYTIETEFSNEPVQPAFTTEALEAYLSANTPDAAVEGDAAVAPTISLGAGALAGASIEVIRNLVSGFVWDWYDAHLEDVVVKFKVKLIFLPVRVTVKVKDCGWLLRALFGDRN